MCTVNMTFEVPEARHIDIEMFKRQVNAFVQLIISTPSIEKMDKDEVDMQKDNLSEEVTWFKNNPVVLTADDMDERTKYILER